MSFEILLGEDAAEYVSVLDEKSTEIVKENLRKLADDPYPRPGSGSGDKEKVTFKRCHRRLLTPKQKLLSSGYTHASTSDNRSGIHQKSGETCSGSMQHGGSFSFAPETSNRLLTEPVN